MALATPVAAEVAATGPSKRAGARMTAAASAVILPGMKISSRAAHRAERGRHPVVQRRMVKGGQLVEFY